MVMVMTFFIVVIIITLNIIVIEGFHSRDQ